MGASLSSPAPAAEFPRLKEFSVVYTSSALNLMSEEFQKCFKDISGMLKDTYKASDFALIPGSGTFAMEAVARQFSNKKKVLIVRNGWFSYRWTQILDMAKITEGEPIIVMSKPKKMSDPLSVWGPPELKELLDVIEKEKPSTVFAPHVETSNGIILPDEYVKAIGEACRKIDAVFVLDCIASGAMWVDMGALNVDVLISAPQKAWSGPACCGFVMLQPRAIKAMESSTSSSFSCDLKKWVEVAKKYEGGSFMYHTTLPTDALIHARDKIKETRDMGLDKVRERQIELGKRIRVVLANRGFVSVAAPGFDAPGVVVVHTPSNEMVSRFAKQGIQIAGFVPFKCNEHERTQTFRVGLFGLEKFDVDATVNTFEQALNDALEQTSKTTSGL